MSEHSEGYRLSPQQRRLHRISSLDPGQYVAQATFEVEGRLDVERLRAAVRSLVQRHEVLRTELSERPDGGVPLQVIGDGTKDCFESVCGTERAAGGGACVGADGGLRVRCEQRGDEQWQVCVSLGAMWSDAESMATLCEQMWAGYDEVDTDEESEDSPLQYVDFSEWQNGLLESEESEAGRAFWRRHDPKHLPPLRLSSESEDEPGATFVPECFDEALDDAVLEAVRAAANECGAEAQEFLLACWMCLLYRLSTNPDVVVNIFERRKHEELDGAIGLIGRALPVHCQFNQKIAFGEVLKRTRRTVVELSKWQEYYADDDTHLDQRTDAPPQHPFIFEHDRRPDAFAAPDATTRLRLLSLRAHSEPFRVKLVVASSSNGRLHLQWHYDPRRFDSTSARRLAAQYLRLLACAASDPSRLVSRLDVLTDEERHTSLVEWNHTEVDYGTTHCLHQLFEQQAAHTPAAVALAYEGEQLTYAELDNRADRLARLLSMKGVGPDVVVGLMMERSVEMVVALLAVLKAGGAYLPLDPEYPSDRLSFMLEDSAVSLLLTQQRLRDRVPEHVAEVICVDSEFDGKGFDADAYDGSGINVTPDNLAYVIYTSGSTGRPKGVMVSHRSISNRLLWMREQYPLTSADTLLQKTSLSFDASVWELFHPLQSGARLLLARPGGERDLNYLVETVAAQGVTVLQVVPSLLRALSEGGTLGRCAGLRLLCCGGESLGEKECEAALGQLSEGARVVNLYGPTEASIDSASRAYEPGCAVGGRVPLGGPIGNVRLYVLDGWGEPAPVGVAGELYVGGAGLARGYLGRPALTAERFVPDPFATEPGARLYRTGDVGRWLQEGGVEFLGRVDQQVKVRGYRIELGEIEAAMRSHGRVRECAVTTRGEGADTRLVAYVVADGGGGLKGSELRAHLLKRLPEYMAPSSFVMLGAMPLTANGKVDRRALPEPDASEGLESTYVAPRTQVEEMLCGIWSEVLGAERVGVNDNFFELGGHSLLVTRAVSRIRDAFGVEIAMRAIFEHPTVGELAAVVESWMRDGRLAPTSIERASRDTHLPLSFAQQRLWFVEQFEKGNAAYNLLTALRLTGRLDVDTLARALEEVIRRHESLRTTFTQVAGNGVQVVGEPFAVSLAPTDLSHINPSERESTAFKLFTEETGRPFDISKGPLLRARLVKLDDEEHILVLVMHHIVGDGWSTDVLLHEVVAIYEAFSEGRPSPLAELPIQYADYAVWQRNRLTGELLDTQLSYWRKQLTGAPTLLELPTDRPRPAAQSFRGASEALALDAELTEALKALSRSEGVTLFMTLLAAFQVLLSRYSGQTDVVVGTDSANRQQGQTESLVGFFINQMALRGDLSGDPTFRGLLGRAREATLGAYAHQEVPFEKVVEELRPERSLSHTPLFQVKLVLQDVPQTKAVVDELTFELIDIDSATVKYDMALFLLQRGEKITGFWKYSTDLFDAATVRRMIRHYQTLLRSAAEQPDASLSRLEMLTEEEKEQRAAEQKQRKELKRKQFMKVVPQAVAVKATDLVKTGRIEADERLPLLVEPAVAEVDLIGWARGNREAVESGLRRHGAILFRGFAARSAAAFEQFARATCMELFGDYGDLPRDEVGGKIYSSTPYPNDKPILFHNESSHQSRWPMRIWFYCAQAASEGGETPIVDCRRVYANLDAAVREQFERKGLKYVRNFTDGLDVSWQEFFRTEDRSVVEEKCRRAGAEYAWSETGLRTSNFCRAVTAHPSTGEHVFFNQVQLHHVSCLDAEVRASVTSLFSEEELPRNVYFGDGSPIPDEAVEHVSKVYRACAVNFPWREGDILMVDNMLVAHGRNPFAGPRKIMVAMGDLVEGRESHTTD